MSRAPGFVRAAATVAAAAALASCGPPKIAGFASAAQPGTNVLSYPASFDRRYSTVFLSNPNAAQGGVDGATLTITRFKGLSPMADQLTIDENGNVGIRGSLSMRSTRAAKRNIAPYAGSALGVLDRTRVVTYNYVNEARGTAPHIGVVAEDSPTEISGPSHRAFNISNSVALNFAAVKELQAEVRELRAQVRALGGCAVSAARTGPAQSSSK